MCENQVQDVYTSLPDVDDEQMQSYPRLKSSMKRPTVNHEPASAAEMRQGFGQALSGASDTARARLQQLYGKKSRKNDDWANANPIQDSRRRSEQRRDFREQRIPTAPRPNFDTQRHQSSYDTRASSLNRIEEAQASSEAPTPSGPSRRIVVLRIPRTQHHTQNSGPRPQERRLTSIGTPAGGQDAGEPDNMGSRAPASRLPASSDDSAGPAALPDDMLSPNIAGTHPI